MGGYTEVEENGRSKGTSIDSVEAWSPALWEKKGGYGDTLRNDP